MELQTVRDAFDRVAKKQKLSTSKYQQVIDQVGDEIKQAMTDIQSADPPSSIDHKSVITNLKRKLDTIIPQEQLEKSQKELNTNLSQYPKILAKFLDTDISKAYRNVDFDLHIINQIIISQLYHEGLFDVADILINEAQEPEIISLRCQFAEMHQILKALRARNLEPALSWVSANRQKLKQSGSNFEFDLRRLQFLELFQKGNQSDAINFAKTYLSPFASNYRNEFLKLMGCLLWPGKLETSPYSDLLLPAKWENLIKEFTKQFCSLIGVSSKNSLSVTIEAGGQGLPTLLKLANIMAVKKQEWAAMKQLPVAVELGREFQFHSVFVCPVSRDQSSDENPPMLLPCGHVLCNQSISKLSKNNTRMFKCPYCPFEAWVAQCRQLCF